MTEKVTLELPEDVARKAHITAARTGRAIEQVLTEWLAQGAERDRDIESLIVPGIEYPIYTPLGNEEAAQILLDALKAYRAKKDDQK